MVGNDWRRVAGGGGAGRSRNRGEGGGGFLDLLVPLGAIFR